MYSTCIYCRAALGGNEALERFPVGRKLAFDAAQGRLWVVCVRCMRWNLTPLEERWEAIEEAERLFRDTRLRVSTNNIGLARLREGLVLVRIGAPQRPEMAAWRYGRQFSERRRKLLIRSGVGLGAVGAIVAGGLSAGFALGGSVYALMLAYDYFVHGTRESVVARVPLDDGQIAAVRRRHLLATRLVADNDDPLGWRLHLRFRNGERTLTGDVAERALALVLPQVNRGGAGESQVQRAVSVLEGAGDPARFAAAAAQRTRVNAKGRLDHERTTEERLSMTNVRTGTMGLRRDEVLALEMALHEENERRALHGELAMLTAAWEEAEQLARIADDLLVPEAVREKLRRLRGEG
jgi:hypothetical protein